MPTYYDGKMPPDEIAAQNRNGMMMFPAAYNRTIEHNPMPRTKRGERNSKRK